MDKTSSEYYRALDLDLIFNLLGNQHSERQMLFARVAVQTRMDEKRLAQLLNEERRYFQVHGSGMRMASGELASHVFLTELGKKKIEEGWTFIKQLEQDELEGIQKKKREQRLAWVPKGWNILLGATTIIFAYLTWDATRENKIHDAKEERWEVEKVKLQTEIDDLTRKYHAVPDSIRQIYK